MTWKEKSKSKPPSPCAVFVQWGHVRSGLRKAAEQVIIKKRKSVPENLLGNRLVRPLLLVHSDPVPLEAFMALQIQTHQTLLPVHQDLWLHRTTQKVFKARVYIHGGNASASAFNSLLLSLTLLNDWLCSSSFLSLSSSIKGLYEVLPINRIWAPATVDADTFSLSGEEYVSLFCIQT